MSDTTVSMECRMCDSVDTVEAPEQTVEAYMNWQGRTSSMYVQTMFPAMTKADRELLLQAYRKRNGSFHWYLCPTCWEKMGEDE